MHLVSERPKRRLQALDIEDTNLYPIVLAALNVVYFEDEWYNRVLDTGTGSAGVDTATIRLCCRSVFGGHRITKERGITGKDLDCMLLWPELEKKLNQATSVPNPNDRKWKLEVISGSNNSLDSVWANCIFDYQPPSSSALRGSWKLTEFYIQDRCGTTYANIPCANSSSQAHPTA
jgi:hypothetical protein